jgi:hypothetical protein
MSAEQQDRNDHRLQNKRHSGLPYDIARIFVRYVQKPDEDASYFQASFQGGGPDGIGGPFAAKKMLRLRDVQQIQVTYKEQLRVLRRLPAYLTIPLDDTPLVKLGREIAEILPETVCRSIVNAVQRAQRRQRGLRLVLEVTPDPQAQALLAIPWELMVLPLSRGALTDMGGEGFLLLNEDISLVRQVQRVGHNTTPALTAPLSVQAFVAEPLGESHIEAASTQAAIAQVLSPEVLADCWYDGPDTLHVLKTRLRTAQPAVLHILCHGKQSNAGVVPRNDLFFVHADGKVQRVSAGDLAPALTLAPVQLVILQACDSGITATAYPADDGDLHNEQERAALESVALALVRQGVPAVVAMQGLVEQVAAGAFAKAFYGELRAGQSLDQAVAVGRIAMRTPENLIDWSLPVVYQGSGQPERVPPFARFADRLFGSIGENQSTARGLIVAIGLLLVAVGIVRWMLIPATTLPSFEALRRPLQVWLLLGIIGPAVIAAAHRGATDASDLSSAVRSSVRRAQWIGAYLGYAVAGILTLGLFVMLWLVGIFERIEEPVPLLLFYALLLCPLFFSYAVTRSQARSALALAPMFPNLFSWGAVTVVLLAMGLLLVFPFFAWYFLAAPGAPFAFLLAPGPSALALGCILISAILLS